MTRLGLIGARGHTGAEIVRLIDRHPTFELTLASSRQNKGRKIADHVDGIESTLRFCELAHEDVGTADLDALILALPNDLSKPWVEAFRAAGGEGPILDLSADHRFDDHWHYGLPEVHRDGAAAARNIANPGCYATSMMLALHPFRDIIAGVPACFGISGYSGAGTTPSDKNDPEKLYDNIIPYSPFAHVHEKEVSRHLGTPVRFLPHVTSFFRGIQMSVTFRVDSDVSEHQLSDRLRDAYQAERLVKTTDDAPWVAHNAGHHHACVGGLTTRGDDVTIYATLDNLLKGAATQAVQNLNLAFGLDEYRGIPID